MIRWSRTVAAAAALVVLPASPALAGQRHPGHPVRFATFNASLNRAAEGDLARDLSTPGNAQAATDAEIIQRARPDVLLVNEFDYDAAGRSARLFQDNYLSRPHNGAAPVRYPYRYVAPVNTGVASGYDLNNDGQVVSQPGTDAYGQDAYGYGFFPGQYGLVVYSRYPIDRSRIRTFQKFLWKDMPGNAMPPGWYSPAEQKIFRLSSKSHWDVPLRIGGRTVHFLVSHPTPPTFDGTEDRNGRRNHDEIRFWSDYVRGARYIYDDHGRHGGLSRRSDFVIAGDMNADPVDGDSYDHAVHQLLTNPRINASFFPTSKGGPEAAKLQAGANLTQKGDPAYDTGDFADTDPGNLHVDYLLPNKGMRATDGAVFWPTTKDPLYRLTGTYPFPSSDHRLIWEDIR